MAKRNTMHGMKGTPTYNSWVRVIQRCTNEKQPNWKNYGGRGIGFDPRWEFFTNFLEDMGPRPTPEHSLDRIDNNADYSKENCRWATDAEQRRNKRNNFKLTHNGKTQCVVDWAKELSVPYGILFNRLSRGWTVEETLTTPILAPGQKKLKHIRPPTRPT